MDREQTIAVIGIIGNFIAIIGILIMRVQYLRLRESRERWQCEYEHAQLSLREMCRQVDELKNRLDTDSHRHKTLLSRHSRVCNDLSSAARQIATLEDKVKRLESIKPNLPKNYLSLIQAMQASTRFMSSNQWLLEQSKELTSAVAALADVADRIESEDELCPR